MAVLEVMGGQVQVLLASLSQPQQQLAVASAAVAALLVIVSAFVRTMIPLRWLAVGSNVGFIAYGLLHPLPLMVVLHVVLLPVNLFRVVQMVRLTRRVSASAADAEQLQLWLRPYMRSRELRAGTMIFRRGDLADRMYYLADGRIELVDFGRTLEAGQMFGEIAFFAPDRRRTSGARCLTRCMVMSIDEDTFKQLYFQNPDFGLEIVRLIAGRLSADVRRLQAREGLVAGAGQAPDPALAPAVAAQAPVPAPAPAGTAHDPAPPSAPAPGPSASPPPMPAAPPPAQPGDGPTPAGG